MSTIDERVVQMQFDNAEFERGVKETMTTLGRLKDSLNFDESSKSLNELQKTADSVDFSKMAKDISYIAEAFTPLGRFVRRQWDNIEDAVENSVRKIENFLVKSPIHDGLNEYETQLTAIQTILANTQSKGSTIEDVTAALDELNTYADQTVYNFTEMTRNIGTFTAAGVGLEASTQAIKGIANLAAISSSTSAQASTVMYQLSQALAAGTVKLQDWNSVVNAGMGGEVFQEALKRTAKNYGIAVDKMIEKNGSFRESLKEGWITSGVLTETLAQIAGTYSEADLLAKGYTEEQTKDILQLADTAMKAATEVKSFSQMLDTLKEALGSGWTKSFEYIFGNINEAKETFTQMSNVLGALIEYSSNARNALLKGWSELGGRKTLFSSIANLFWDIITPLGIIKKAFYEIFPKTTENTLIAITNKFHEFTRVLMINDDTAMALYNTASGVFKVLKAGIDVISAIGRALSPVTTKLLSFVGIAFQVVGVVTQAIAAGVEYAGQLGILEKIISGIQNAFGIALIAVASFVGGIGILIAKVVELVKSFVGVPEVAAVLQNISQVLSTVSSAIVTVIDTIISKVSSLITAFNEGGLGGALGILNGVGDGFKSLYAVISESVSKIVSSEIPFVSKAVATLSSAFGKLASIGSSKFEAIVKSVKNLASAFKAKGLSGAADILRGIGDAIANLYSKGVDRISKIIASIQNFVSEFTNSKGFAIISDIVGKVLAAFETLYSVTSTKLASATTFIKNFIASVKTNGLSAAISPVLAAISNGLTNVAGVAKTAGTYITSFFSAVASGVRGLLEVKDSIEEVNTATSSLSISAHEVARVGKGAETASQLDTAAQAFDRFKETIVEFAKVASERLKNVDLKTIITTMFGVALVKLVLSLSTLTVSISKLVNNSAALTTVFSHNIAATFKTINTTVTNFTNSITKSIDTFSSGITKALNRAANAFWKSDVVQIAVGLVMLAGALYVLSKVPAKDLENASLAMIKLAASLAVLMTINGIMTKLNKGSNGLEKIGIGMAAMAAAVLVLVVALKQFESITIDVSMWDKLGILGVLMLELIASSILMDKAAPQMSRGALALLAFAFSTKKLAEALMTLGNFTGTNVVGALDSLTQIALIMMGLAVVSSKASIGSSVGLLTMAAAVYAFEKALEKIAANDSGFNQLAETLKTKFTFVLDEIKAFFKKFEEDSKFAQNAIGYAGTFMLFLTWFALIARTAGNASVKAAIGIAGLIGCVELLREVFVKIKDNAFDFSNDNFIQSLGALALGLGYLGLIAALGSTTSIKLMAVLPVLLGTFTLLAKVFKMIQNDFQDSTSSSLWRAAKVMSVLAAVIGGLIAVTALTKNAKMGPLLSVIGILGAVVSGIAVLSILDTNGLLAGGLALASSLLAIGYCIDVIGSMNTKQANNVLKTFIPIAVTIAALTASFYILVNYPWNQVISAGASLGLAMLSIGGALKLAQGAGFKASASLVLAAIGACAVAVALTPLANFNSNAPAIIAAGASLGIAMLGIAGASVIAKTAVVGAAAMLIAAVGASAVALALSPLAQYNWESIVAAGGSLSVAMLAISGASLIAQAGLVGAGVLLILAADAAIIAASLSVFANHDWEAIAAAGASLSAVMLAIAGASVIAQAGLVGAGVISVVILAISAAMLSFGKAAEMFGAGADLFATAIQKLVESMDQVANMSPDSLQNLASNMQAVGSSLALGVSSFFATLAQQITQGMSGIVQIIVRYVPSFAAAGVSAIVGIISGVAEGAGSLVSAGFTVAKGFFDSVVGVFRSLPEAGVYAVTGLVSGVGKVISNVTTAGAYLGQTFLNGFREITGWHSPWESMIKAGWDAVIGIVKSIRAGYDAARAAGQGLGASVIEGAKEGLSIASSYLADSDMVTQAEKWFPDFKSIFDFSGAANKAKDAISDLIPDLGDLSGNFSDLGGKGGSVGGASSAIQDNTDKIQNAAKFMDYARESVRAYAQTYGYMSNIIGDTTGVDAGIQAIEQLAKSLYEAERASDDVQSTASGAEDRIDEIKKAFIELYETINDAVKSSLDTFDKFSYSFENNSKSMLRAIKSNNKITDVWADGLQYLVEKGFDEGIIKKIGEEGPSSLNTLTSLLRMSSDEVAEYNRQYTEAQTKSGTVAAQVVASVAAAQQRKIQMDNLAQQSSESATFAADASTNANQAMVDSITQTAEQLKEQGEVIQAIYENIKKSLEDTLESQLDYFNAFDGGESVIISEFIGNMESQIAGYNKYANDWENLAKKGYSEDFLLEIEKLGVDGANYVNMLSKASDEMVQRINNDFDQLATLPERTAQRVTDSLAQNTSIFSAIIPDSTQLIQQMTDIGVNAAQGFINGIASITAKPQASELGLEALESLKTELQEQSPSKATHEIGAYYVKGFINGITDTAGAAYETVREFAEGVLSTASEVWGIASPSKVMESFGRFIDLGLANGISNNESAVTNSLGSITGKALNTTKSILAALEDAIESGADLSPVITPVLDMSNLKTGINSANSMLSTALDMNVSTLNVGKAAGGFYDRAASEKIQNDNSDIISAISRIDERLDSLGNSIMNLKIVMDTGATVGALEEKIDRRLGQRAVMAGRGN